VCDNGDINFYAETQEYPCNRWSYFEGLGEHEKIDFSDFAVSINNKSIQLQKSFVAVKNNVDVTERLLKYGIGDNACGKFELDATEDNKNKYKGLIDDGLLFIDKSLTSDDLRYNRILPSWNMKKRYAWKVNFSENKNIEIKTISTTIAGREWISRLEDIDSLTHDQLLSNLPSFSSSKALRLLDRDKNDKTRVSYAIIPLGFLGKNNTSTVNVRLYHNPMLLFPWSEKDASSISEDIRKLPFAVIAYANKWNKEKYSESILPYGKAIDLKLENVSLPDDIVILSFRKSPHWN